MPSARCAAAVLRVACPGRVVPALLRSPTVGTDDCSCRTSTHSYSPVEYPVFMSTFSKKRSIYREQGVRRGAASRALAA